MLFLKMVLFDQMNIEQPSLDQHCMLLAQQEHLRFCKQAIDKRFSDRAVAFLEALLEGLLKNQVSSSGIVSGFADRFAAIRLMDSTEFKLPTCMKDAFPGFDGDGTASCTQIQFEYDILSGKINSLGMGDARIADSAYAAPLLDTIKAGELIIRDLGYSKIDSFKRIQSTGAYYISRLSPNTNIYEKCGEHFTPVSYKTLYNRLRVSGKNYLDVPIYLGREAKYPVRLMASLLPEQATQRRRQRKIYRRNSHPQHYRYLSRMNLFITNATTDMLPAEQAYNLYKVRWQIELIFKAWKSILRIDKVRKMKPERFKCYLLGKLIWILINWSLCNICSTNLKGGTKKPLSIYKCFAILKTQARTLQQIIIHQKSKLRSWLMLIYSVVAQFGLKENKKGRITLTTLLDIK